MVAKNKAITGKGQVKKLKLKKETLKDLMPRKAGADAVKGGKAPRMSSAHVCDSDECSF